jgi:phosphohistidine phosphatase SixA
MPGEPGSHMDLQYCSDIGRIAQSLNRIANCMEADEKRKRAHETTSLEDIERMGPAIAAVKRGFAAMEEAALKQAREKEEG